jgi:hypothetical protein
MLGATSSLIRQTVPIMQKSAQQFCKKAGSEIPPTSLKAAPWDAKSIAGLGLFTVGLGIMLTSVGMMGKDIHDHVVHGKPLKGNTDIVF